MVERKSTELNARVQFSDGSLFFNSSPVNKYTLVYNINKYTLVYDINKYIIEEKLNVLLINFIRKKKKMIKL